MLVYSDSERLLCPRACLAQLRRRLAEVGAVPPGVQRHAWRVALLVEAGELAQGLLDDRFRVRGRDEACVLSERALGLVLQLARWVVRSWEAGFAEVGEVGPVEPLLAALERLPLPERVSARVQEGFACYALYPEVYAAAAQALRGEAARVCVVGIRSIGATLAGVVAAALGQERAPLTVRPVGPVFARELSLSAGLRARLRAHEGPFAVVDEGPGLSGSSFGAVVGALEQEGVALSRVHLLPSHGGAPGPEAREPLRRRWEQLHRHVGSFERVFLAERGSPLHLARWVEDVVGPAEGPLEDVGGGQWRARVFSSRLEWPAAHVQQERTKYLLRAGGRTWLLKFAGVGRYGEARYARARTLQQVGLVPPVVALRHGFLCQEWLPGARPLSVAPPVDRGELVRAVADYLAFLARHFAAGEEAPGAGPGKLLEMAHYNTECRLGARLAGVLEGWRGRLGALAGQVRRVRTDNRMHAWEWLVLPEGRLVKADALDHHQAHDLVGCQDLAWDVVGATVELGLSAGEQAVLVERLERRLGRRWSPEVLDFHLDCYLAFQLGHHALAARALAAVAADESRRLEQAARRYERLLQARLERR